MLQAQMDQLGKNIRKSLGVDSVEIAVETLKSQCATASDIIELQQEFTSLGIDQNQEDDHFAQLFHKWKDAEQHLAAVGDDGEAARLEEERQVLLLQIEQEANTYMRLIAGTLMVGEALRTYREIHRSAMMQRASDAFVTYYPGKF